MRLLPSEKLGLEPDRMSRPATTSVDTIDYALAVDELMRTSRLRSVTKGQAHTPVDDEIYHWFRARWPMLDVHHGTELGARELRDRDWWTAFRQHLGALKVRDLERQVLVQVDTTKPVDDGDNVRFVPRVVWLAIEVCRACEAVSR